MVACNKMWCGQCGVWWLCVVIRCGVEWCRESACAGGGGE